jgi:hypothetical protein
VHDGKSKQSRLQEFFANKKEDFVKRTTRKRTLENEEIEDESDEDIEEKKDKPATLSDRKKEKLSSSSEIINSSSSQEKVTSFKFAKQLPFRSQSCEPISEESPDVSGLNELVSSLKDDALLNDIFGVKGKKRINNNDPHSDGNHQVMKTFKR